MLTALEASAMQSKRLHDELVRRAAIADQHLSAAACLAATSNDTLEEVARAALDQSTTKLSYVKAIVERMRVSSLVEAKHAASNLSTHLLELRQDVLNKTDSVAASMSHWGLRATAHVDEAERAGIATANLTQSVVSAGSGEILDGVNALAESVKQAEQALQCGIDRISDRLKASVRQADDMNEVDNVGENAARRAVGEAEDVLVKTRDALLRQRSAVEKTEDFLKRQQEQQALLRSAVATTLDSFAAPYELAAHLAAQRDRIASALGNSSSVTEVSNVSDLISNAKSAAGSEAQTTLSLLKMHSAAVRAASGAQRSRIENQTHLRTIEQNRHIVSIGAQEAAVSLRLQAAALADAQQLQIETEKAGATALDALHNTVPSLGA